MFFFVLEKEVVVTRLYKLRFLMYPYERNTIAKYVSIFLHGFKSQRVISEDYTKSTWFCNNLGGEWRRLWMEQFPCSDRSENSFLDVELSKDYDKKTFEKNDFFHVENLFWKYEHCWKSMVLGGFGIGYTVKKHEFLS